MSPSTTFQGRSARAVTSVPTMNTDVMAPSGSRQAEKPATTGVTSVTPSVPARRSLMVVGRRERSSKYFAPLETTHRSVEV